MLTKRHELARVVERMRKRAQELYAKCWSGEFDPGEYAAAIELGRFADELEREGTA